MDQQPFNQEAYDHIQGSGMDPVDLAKLYGITKRMVDRIQMGKMTFEQAVAEKKAMSSQ